MSSGSSDSCAAFLGDICGLKGEREFLCKRYLEHLADPSFALLPNYL